MSVTKCDISIIGAGPYGLSAAAHLRAIPGLDVHVFGEPMSFWERHMPTGMLLRSPWEGSNLSDPQHSLTLDAYKVASDNHLSAPVPLERFVKYGQWFQRQVAPDTDPRKVLCVAEDSGGFRIALEDGDVWRSRRVVVATGVAAFAWRPPEFAKLSNAVVSHTSDHRELSCFAGKKVMVIGSGQSALESAALLHESGAEVELVVRMDVVRWLWRYAWLHTCKPLARLLYAPSDVGPAAVSHLVERPNWYRRFPRCLQDRFAVIAIRPAGAGWLKPRLNGVPIRTGRRVVSAVASKEGALVKLDDQRTHYVDHILLGTGYRVDISRYRFLDKELLRSVRRVDGFPCLSRGLESSVAGLHFLGAPAAWSFGPLMRFVAGTDFASQALARSIRKSS
jgi:cation diffusion facilitator CzcD-associated flavoprotein CzcO